MLQKKTGFTTMVANAGGPVLSLYLLSAGFRKLGFLGTSAWFFLIVNTSKVPFSVGLGLIDARSLLLGVITLGLLALLVCEAFVLRGFGASAPAGLDYLIVLGAQVREDGPSRVLQYRLDAAADYLRENPSTLCIVTGGRGATEPVSEGEGMRDYLLSQGIAGSRILVEDKALNTVQNINLSKRLMSSPDAPAALVTNNFHVSRALALARKQGLTDVYAIAAPSDPLFLPNNMFREFFGFTKDFLAGNI